jgi:hypothetical protein
MGRKSKRPITIAITSDQHANSTLAAVPPEGCVLDDGGKYQPSAVNSWIWDCWTNYWERVAQHVKYLDAELWCVFNGDLVEGTAHHGTTQVVSSHPEPQAYLADRIFGVPRSLAPQRTFVVRGTEAHVGPSGATEEAFARSIRAEKDHATGRWSWWQLRLAPHGCLIDCAHHPSIGGNLPWTQPQAVQRLAFLVFSHHAVRGMPHPKLVIRSHRHVTGDSYDAYPTRAIITPAFQLKTAYAHKVAADSIADIGGIVITADPDGSYSVQRHLYEVKPPEPWRPA